MILSIYQINKSIHSISLKQKVPGETSLTITTENVQFTVLVEISVSYSTGDSTLEKIWSTMQMPWGQALACNVYGFTLDQGSPPPWTGTSQWPVRNWVAQQEVRGGRAKLHLYLQPLPIPGITAWALPPVRSATALDSHRSANPAVNHTCEGSRLCAPYENLMPDDLRWSWGGDASAGERLQIQIIISREVWPHRDHNKSVAGRLISKPYQWAASENKLKAPTDCALRWVV